MTSFNENDLIAYHLHELPPRRARALEKALHMDQALAAESKAYAAILRSFKGGVPLEVNEEIVQRNWNGLRSKLPRQPLGVARFPQWLVPALCGVGLSFAATFLFMTARLHMPPVSSTASMKEPSSTAPSVANTENSSDTNTATSRPDSQRLLDPQQRISRAIPWSDHPIMLPHNESPRIIASIPRNSAEPESVVHYIPLAQAPIASLPPLNPSLLHIQSETAQPVTPSQGPETRSSLKRQRNWIQLDHSMDVTLAMGGMLIGTRDFSINGAALSQGATPAVSAIASFHQQLQPFVGYRVTVSYDHPDFHYGASKGQFDISARIYEVAGTYVVQGPHHGIVNTTFEAGAGLMALQPSTETAQAGKDLRGAAIASIGADFAVSKHFAVHTGYRIQVFKGTDFQSAGNVAPIVATTLITNEPIVGITYRFRDK